MKGIISASGAAIVAAVLATPAVAQQVGTYTGTSADGSSLTFVVGTDPNNGYYQLTSAGIGFSAPCRNHAYVLNSAWGLGLAQDIIDRKTGKFSQTDNYFTFNITLEFSKDGLSATGTIVTFSPTLDPVGAEPKKALFCESPKQTLSLTLQSTADTDKQVKESSHFLGPNGNTH